MSDNPDQISDHVPSVPTAGVAPEFHHYPVNKEPNANVQSDDINIPLVVASVAVSAILLFVIVTWIQAWYYNTLSADEQATFAPYATVVQTRATQQEQLTQTRWVDQAKGEAAIPIDKAIDLTVAEYQKH